jgi:signal transduction histidine kinase
VLEDRGDEARLSVRDTGIGLRPDQRERVFERFYQADATATRAHGGAGLGLAVAKAIVCAHGGTIGVESELGRGATFWVEIPKAPVQAG